ncbi:MAG: Hsp70 family protein [Deltaproteobacteria bacterium]|nr:Hsp70 family protein [Deltaproteobacteria bacterium]
MADSPLYAGFDLGTSNSAAAIFDGDQVTVIRNAQGGAVTPSVVRLDKAGRVTVGARARRMLEQDPANTATEFKRLMGTGRAIEFPAAGVSRSPEALSAEVLKALRADIADQRGVEIARAVISVPALFELPQSAATSEAARLAGFERVELLQEPIASALAAGWREDQGGAWLVYDLGGGTFDVSLLETRDGLLRVVGHDGDNFLGGRDFDWAITELCATKLGGRLARANPAHANALRTLRLAAEDAKIELSRSPRAQVSLQGPLVIDGDELEVDLELTRDEVEAACRPLVERSLEVCLRLLANHGLAAGGIAKVVLVGGPTVMPMVRAAVAARLDAAVADGLDPMTLVAQGAALYAATAGLDGRAAKSTTGSTGRRVWLQYPAVSSDLTPHVVGRFVGGAPPASVTLARGDGGWRGTPASVSPDGGFITTVTLVPRKAQQFTIEAVDAAGATLEVEPPSFTIVQGVTIGDPPLPRAIGVALASNGVQVYFERGAPLPARRTFRHKTVETVAKGGTGSVLKIPIVQGELAHAHLCRLVGTLEIPGAEIKDTVPVGSTVEVTIELDRGGRMAARALVPVIDQVFERVVHLLVPEADPAALDASIADLRRRLQAARLDSFQRRQVQAIERLDKIEARLAEAEKDIDAAHGGDADAAQKARRGLLEVDATLAEVELAHQWPQLENEARSIAIIATSQIGAYGSDAEKKLLDEVLAAIDAARAAKDPAELERQVHLARRLATAAYQRNPAAWENYFDDAASEVSTSTDLPKAEQLVKDGKAAIDRGDTEALKRIVRGLWDLQPIDVAARRMSFDSGVR